MGKPDLTEKMLLDFNDEFAEVFSAFAFQNKLKLNPDHLHEASTEYHHFEQGQPKELRRDIVKIYDGLQLGIVVLGIENQTDIDPIMPIRIMGYNWTRYRYQASHAKELPPHSMLSPVFSHVINFSYTRKWDWPLSLKDIISVPKELEDFFQDYKIDVTNVAWMTPQERSVLTGDFRILADTLCAIRETGRIPGGKKTIRHVDELLATLAAVTNRKYCFDMPIHQDSQGEQTMTMDDVLTKWEDGLRAEGYRLGEQDGQKAGFQDGQKAGFQDGQKAGFQDGQKRSAVFACQDFGKSMDETISYLMQRYDMTLDDARNTTQTYWQT